MRCGGIALFNRLNRMKPEAKQLPLLEELASGFLLYWDLHCLHSYFVTKQCNDFAHSSPTSVRPVTFYPIRIAVCLYFVSDCRATHWVCFFCRLCIALLCQSIYMYFYAVVDVLQNACFRKDFLSIILVFLSLCKVVVYGQENHYNLL